MAGPVEPNAHMAEQRRGGEAAAAAIGAGGGGAGRRRWRRAPRGGGAARTMVSSPRDRGCSASSSRQCPQPLPRPASKRSRDRSPIFQRPQPATVASSVALRPEALEPERFTFETGRRPPLQEVPRRRGPCHGRRSRRVGFGAPPPTTPTIVRLRHTAHRPTTPNSRRAHERTRRSAGLQPSCSADCDRRNGGAADGAESDELGAQRRRASAGDRSVDAALQAPLFERHTSRREDERATAAQHRLP